MWRKSPPPFSSAHTDWIPTDSDFDSLFRYMHVKNEGTEKYDGKCCRRALDETKETLKRREVLPKFSTDVFTARPQISVSVDISIRNIIHC